MGKYIIETVQVVRYKYYVEVNDPQWACDAIIFEELDPFSYTHHSEDVIGVRAVEEFPMAEKEDTVNAATMHYNYETGKWDKQVRWDLNYEDL